jgi:ADP-heptose:LPS heptosyltransferase
MHAANAVETPVVALFARLTAEMQLTKASSANYLYDRESVINIKPEDVFEQYNRGLDRVANQLSMQSSSE